MRLQKMYTFETAAPDQYPVVDRTPSSDNYSSAFQIHRVTFNGEPSLLVSVEEIEAAEAAGDITIEALSIIVNYPLVKWDNDELPTDTELVATLGGGPLISAPNPETMLVTFKLHECYPAHRYIITDTSLAGMAPMMSIAASPPTQALNTMGATDEVWVFANGIEGPGVMGFQPAIFDNQVGSPIWSPFWDHFTVEWADPSQAVVVQDSTQLRALIDDGSLILYNGVPNTHPDGFVVNCPSPIKASTTFEHRL